MNTLEFIKEEEGFREKPYLDTLGVPTFGYGFTWISKEEANAILRERIVDIEKELQSSFEWYNHMNDTRKTVLVSMVYQLGMGGLMKFKNFIKALEAEDYDLAALEMLDSRWAAQTPNRANRQSDMIKNG